MCHQMRTKIHQVEPSGIDLTGEAGWNVFKTLFGTNHSGKPPQFGIQKHPFQGPSIGTSFQGPSIGTPFQGPSIGTSFQRPSIETPFQRPSIETPFQGPSISSHVTPQRAVASSTSARCDPTDVFRGSDEPRRAPKPPAPPASGSGSEAPLDQTPDPFAASEVTKFGTSTLDPARPENVLFDLNLQPAGFRASNPTLTSLIPTGCSFRSSPRQGCSRPRALVP